eukprot:3929709-Ditylum_brightwellii.AAC.1
MGNGESLSMDDIKKHKILDQNELDDEEWASAPIIVSTNHKRLDISEIQTKRYTKQHKPHVIRLQLDITEWKGKPKRWQQALHENPIFNQYYVEGVTVYVTKNLQVKMGLADGSKAKYHSLTCVDEA